MSPKVAVSYASLLGIVGTMLLWTVTNMLSVAIVLVGFTIYVCVYSCMLKRSSIYGMLIGSLAGAAPPLAGYCAVTNRFDMGALILLSIFVLWQMPHAYAIAIFRFNDYTAAAIPVLPVKAGDSYCQKTYHWLYTGLYGGSTDADPLSVTPATTTLPLWRCFACPGCSMAWSGYKTSDDRLWAKKQFVLSILTVFALSIMMSIDFTVSAAPGMLLTRAP